MSTDLTSATARKMALNVPMRSESSLPEACNGAWICSPYSLVPEGHQGIDLGGATGGQVTGQERNSHEEQCICREGQRIGWAHAE